jgi:hypothetical protein
MRRRGWILVAALAASCADDTAPTTAMPPDEEDCDCDECEDACDPAGNGDECVQATCAETGQCACYVETAATDCPESGCCGPQYDEYGQPLLDGYGQQIYGCVVPWCWLDEDCAAGEVCVIGATCDQNYCACNDEDSDEGFQCCPVQNAWHACCETELVDESTGLCVCSDSVLMVDDGDGCACPVGMTPDEDGQCVCMDFLAEYDAVTGACACPAGTAEELDEDGTVRCWEPIACDDEYSEYDPETGGCECIDGYVLGEHPDFVTPRCVWDERPPYDAPPPDAWDGPPPDAPFDDAWPIEDAWPSGDACEAGFAECGTEN